MMTRTILCVGDSNTHGTIPMPTLDGFGRFGHEARWPSVMGAALGTGYEVIAEGQTITELSAELALGRWVLIGGVENLFNVEWNEAQFATTSRLRGEAGPVTELHFTPGSGRALRVGVRVAR